MRKLLFLFVPLFLLSFPPPHRLGAEPPPDSRSLGTFPPSMLKTLGLFFQLQVNQNGNLRVEVYTGTTAAALALEASLVKLTLAQGSTTSGQSGPLVQGAVTAATPTYTTATTSPLSMNVSGQLRTTLDNGITLAASSGPIAAAEDEATTSGLVGIPSLVMREDTPSTTTSASGDFTLPKSDSAGRAWVTAQASAPVHSRPSDGAAAQTWQETDVDSGVGTVNRIGAALLVPASGGAAALTGGADDSTNGTIKLGVLPAVTSTTETAYGSSRQVPLRVLRTGYLATFASFLNRSDTYTATGNGATLDVSTNPPKSFAVQVKGTGAAATTWDVRLEGSLDNVNFTQILQHTNTTGDGAVLFSGATLSPSLYFRSRTAGLTLGAATNIVVTILGTE